MKLLPQIFLLAVIPLCVLVGFSWYHVHGLIERLDTNIEQQLEQTANHIRNQLQQRIAHTSDIAEILAISEEVQQASVIQDQEFLFLRGRVFTKLGIDYIAFFNQNTQVLARGHDEFQFGDTLENPWLNAALQGNTIATISPFDNDWYILAITPLKVEDSLIGAVVVGDAMNSGLLREMGQQRRVEIEFYDAHGKPLASSRTELNGELMDSMQFDFTLQELQEIAPTTFQVKLFQDNRQERLTLLELEKNILSFTVFLGIMLLAVIVFFVRKLIKPIRVMVREMARFASGDRTLTPLIIPSNEIGEIATAFTDLRKENVELLKRLEDNISTLEVMGEAFRRFVPKDFLEHLKRASIVEVQLGDCVQREMTVLFSDLRSFTTISESMSPEENFRFLNAYLGQMGPIIQKNHGFIDKYIGDAIMALFDKETDDAVRAAIEMFKQLNHYNTSRTRAERPAIHMGVGIHTGTMMLGTIGERNRMETTVISDVVNAAARLEGMTKMYGVSLLISDFVHNSLKRPSELAARVIDRVTAKGKKDPITIFEVFNGDPPEIFDLKSATVKQFEEGISLYHMKEFSEARMQFESCLSRFPQDTAAQLYIKRCKHYEKVGWDHEWDGITHLDTK